MSFTRTGIMPISEDECYCTSLTSTVFEGTKTWTCAKCVSELRSRLEPEIRADERGRIVEGLGKRRQELLRGNHSYDFEIARVAQGLAEAIAIAEGGGE